MKKSLKILKEIASVVFILIVLLKLSDYLHNAASSHIITVLFDNVGHVGVIIFIFEFFISCYNVIDAKLKKEIKSTYITVKKNLREQIVRSLRTKPNELSVAALGQILVVFNNNKEIMTLVIKELKNRFISEIESENIISYLFLENEYDNEFVQFFIENPEEKSGFERISHKISAEFVDKIYNGMGSFTDNISVNDMLIPLRHVCIPHNFIEEDRFIFVCRTLLDFFYENLKKLDFEKDEKNISIFLLCIPLLKKKISHAKIHNEQLSKKIVEISDSASTNKVIKKAYKKIVNLLQAEAGSEYDCEEIAYCASLVSTYFDKLLPHQKAKLYAAVKRFNKNIASAYHNYTADKSILLLVSSSIFSGIKEQQDLLDEAISLAYLCASAVETEEME